MWGKDPCTSRKTYTWRIIPTGVGKRSPAAIALSIAPDHPHGCGEKSRKGHLRNVHDGLSPRVWGKAHCWISITKCGRIIPTGVGKRSCSTTRIVISTDHPHGCGEKQQISMSRQNPNGSSPRVWGKAHSYQTISACLRIIPTGVGKSFYSIKLSPSVADHPHGCGEKGRSERPEPYEVGSSPRVWGKATCLLPVQIQQRIIPTGVGKRVVSAPVPEIVTDHPHGCGEKQWKILFALTAPGSSPRVWGKV